LAALAIMAGRRRRPRGHIEQVASGSFRAKVYAGIDPWQASGTTWFS
jgi:hypothetical protein